MQEKTGRFDPDILEIHARLLRWAAALFANTPDAETVRKGEELMYAAKDWQVYATIADDIRALMESYLLSPEKRYAVEYANLFCGFSPNAPFPYESVYSDGERLLMRAVRDDVLRSYSEAGFKVRLGDSNEPEDHLSIELLFLAWLTERATTCLRAKQLDKAAGFLRERMCFAREHPCRWLDSFVRDVAEQADGPFYPLAARTAVFLVNLCA